MNTEQGGTSFDVRVWKVDVYNGAKRKTYRVRWAVAGQERRRGHRTAALADSFRSQLMTAARRGDAFDIATGLPLGMLRDEKAGVSWYEFACRYVDMKWPRAAATYRRGIAEALTSVTMEFLDTPVDKTAARACRSALLTWGFTPRRGAPEQPENVTERLRWLARHTRPVGDMLKHGEMRRLLDAISLKLDGTLAAATVVNRKRAVLHNALEYAVELGLIGSNPVRTVVWKAPKRVVQVDRRSVPNPAQARQLLQAVNETPRSGPHLLAFFGCMYYSALRPEEAVNLKKPNLDLPPDEGWGWLILEKAAPDAGKTWTDSGEQRDLRQLKHRAVGQVRRVPCPPELVRLLKAHLATYGVDKQGRLFRGERGGALATLTYSRVWDRARRRALGPEVAQTLLARRPYDLRHAAVSTWLAAGGEPVQIAEWAGHSVDVLLKVYAKCIDGQEHVTLARIGAYLRSESK